MIPTYGPAVTLTLTRLIKRDGGDALPGSRAVKTIDLTPYLGEGSIIRTRKDLMQPAGGMVVTLVDRLNPILQDSLYGLMEPMDMLELRGSRNPFMFQGSLPLIMRAFITSVSRAESMGDDGTPQRMVVVNAQDSGKLLMIHHLLFEVALTSSDPFLSTFHLEAMTGISVYPLAANDFMGQVVSKVINPKITQLNVFADTQLGPFTVEASVPDGIVIPQLGNFDLTTIWGLIEYFADRPWNEVFVRDAEAGPVLVFRPAPYKDLKTGAYIMNGAVDPGSVYADIADVVEINMGRTDQRVANFYWVDPGPFELGSAAEINAAAMQQGWPIDYNYPNDHPALFGLRRMVAQSRLLPSSTTNEAVLLPPSARDNAVSSVITWAQIRAKQLALMNRDNSAFEEGSMTLKGSEDIVPGAYLQLQRGGLASEAYIAAVSHSIPPLGPWMTEVSLIRGNGFYVRSQVSTSAFLAEGRKGPYDQ